MSTLIELFRPFAHDRFVLEVEVAKYLSGNIIRRQEVQHKLTGEIPALKDCTIFNVARHLKAYFDQPQLFQETSTLENMEKKIIKTSTDNSIEINRKKTPIDPLIQWLQASKDKGATHVEAWGFWGWEDD